MSLDVVNYKINDIYIIENHLAKRSHTNICEMTMSDRLMTSLENNLTTFS